MTDRAVGLVYTPGLEGLIRTRGLVDLIEIEPEMFWWERAGTFGLHRRAWELARALPLPKVVHGVGSAVGGTVAPPPEYLSLLRRCVDELDAMWASHHLAFNWFGGPDERRCAGFFLPPRQTDDGVRAVASSIRAMATALARPFAVETGVSYFLPRDDELPDGEFVARVCRAADCSVLLDLHNLWANQRNGRQPVEAYLAALPLERVIEVHVAGGFSLDGFWLDAHSGVPPGDVLDLLDEVLPRLPAARAVTFEILAPFVPSLPADAAGAILERIRRSWDRPRGRVTSTARGEVAAAPAGGPSPAEWEQAVGGLAIGRPPATPLARELAADPAADLLRKLVAQARAGTVTDGLPVTVRLLVHALGPEGTVRMFEQFWRDVPPQPFASMEAESLAAWLRDQGPEVPFLGDALCLDLASGRAESTGEAIEVSLAVDPRELCEALSRGALPSRRAERVLATVTPMEHPSAAG